MSTLDNQNLIKSILKNYYFKKKQQLYKINNKHIMSLLLQTNTVENTINPRGVLLLENEKYEDALAIFNKNLELDEEHIDSVYNKGLCLYNLKSYMEALKILLKIKINYKQAAHFVSLCRKVLENEYNDNFLFTFEMEQEGKYQAAIDYYNDLILIFPNNLGYYTNKGNLLTKLGKYDEAIQCYDYVIANQQTTTFTAYFGKAEVLGKLGLTDEAIYYYGKGNKTWQKSSYRHLSKGNFLYRLGLFDKAIKSYDKAIVMNPGMVDAYISKGDTLSSLTKYEEAIDCYNEALKLNSSKIPAITGKVKALESLLKMQ
jgi:tetratricopeptide (TPR) repeat protein